MPNGRHAGGGHLLDALLPQQVVLSVLNSLVVLSLFDLQKFVVDVIDGRGAPVVKVEVPLNGQRELHRLGRGRGRAHETVPDRWGQAEGAARSKGEHDGKDGGWTTPIEW